MDIYILLDMDRNRAYHGTYSSCDKALDYFLNYISNIDEDEYSNIMENLKNTQIKELNKIFKEYGFLLIKDKIYSKL
jgi:hypothetical protein